MQKLSLVSLFVLLTGCALGPDFVEPDHQDLNDYMLTPAVAEQSAALLGWQQVYQDPHLQRLIKTALANNLDLKMARSRVLSARANQTMSDASLWPQLDINGTYERERVNKTSPIENTFELKGLFSWEVDIFGANQRASEVALADFKSSAFAKDAIQLGLVAEVASQFYHLKQIEEEISITNNTINVRKKELSLARLRKQSGVISGLEQKQAEVEFESAKASLPPLLLAKTQIENALRVLMGDASFDVSGGNELYSQYLPAQLKPGLPSDLLKRRPDVRQALSQWQSATANIGVAKANLFPRFSLTSEYGGQSAQLSDVLKSNNVTWGVGIDVLSPIFNAGKNLANLDQAEQSALQAGLNYQKVVLVTLQEVSNEIASFQSSNEGYQAQRSLMLSTKEYVRLARLRYKNGVASSLDLMDAQRQLFSAEVALTKAHNARFQAAIRLYRALGGGWSEQDIQASTST